MSINIIQQKLLSYNCKTLLEQENALKEIAQEIALAALSRANFFKKAAFHGGTCLRIFYGLERFSEDLDFVLEKADPHFDWESYAHHLIEEFNAYGFSLEIKHRTTANSTVKKTFLKADSTGGILILKDLRTNRPYLRIKLEIDTNPPEGSTHELKYLDFPLPYSIKIQSLPSLFAGKCHALLCRKYIKGRDWFDFIWYVSQRIPVNFVLLQHSLIQIGPWQNQTLKLTPAWLIHELALKINHIDWSAAKQDVARFLRPRQLTTIEAWSQNFFQSYLEKLTTYTQDI